MRLVPNVSSVLSTVVPPVNDHDDVPLPWGLLVARRSHSAGLPNPWTDPFPITRADFRPIVTAVFVETLLYGIHVVLYIFSSYVLLHMHKRNRFRSYHHATTLRDNHNDDHGDTNAVRGCCIPISNPCPLERMRMRLSIQLVSFLATTVMFILSTVDVGISWSIVMNHYSEYVDGLRDTKDFFDMIYPKFLIHLVNNMIADILLITRCYIIWSYNHILGGAAVVLLLVGTVLGFISEATMAPRFKELVGPYIFVVFFLNLMLTGLTAGRIWWIAREVGKIMGRQVIRPYNLTVGILLESGFLYSAAIISLIILSRTTYILVAATICIRMVSIMPIFIVVHVALGRGTKNLETSVSAARSNEMQLSTALQFRTSISTGVVGVDGSNIRSQV